MPYLGKRAIGDILPIASMAHENLTNATTAVLLAGLARQIKATADPDHADIAEALQARSSNNYVIVTK